MADDLKGDLQISEDSGVAYHISWFFARKWSMLCYTHVVNPPVGDGLFPAYKNEAWSIATMMHAIRGGTA
jgi:hypothetical protein